MKGNAKIHGRSRDKHNMLASGGTSSDQSRADEIRKNIIELDLVNCMVALPARSRAAAFSRLLVEPS